MSREKHYNTPPGEMQGFFEKIPAVPGFSSAGTSGERKNIFCQKNVNPGRILFSETE